VPLSCYVIEGSAVTIKGRGLPGECLPALYGNVDVLRVQLDRVAGPPRHLSGNNGRA